MGVIACSRSLIFQILKNLRCVHTRSKKRAQIKKSYKITEKSWRGFEKFFMFLKTFYIIFHRNISIFSLPPAFKKRLGDRFSKKFMTLFERTKRRIELRFAAFCR